MSDWQTEAGVEGYSPDKFYTGSRDRRTGYQSSAKVNIPASMGRAISKLIQGGKCPDLVTSNDFFRNAAVHSLQYLADHGYPELSEDAKMVRVEIETEQFNSYLDSRDKTLRVRQEQVSKLKSAEEKEEFKRQLQSAIESSKDSYFKSELRRILDSVR